VRVPQLAIGGLEIFYHDEGSGSPVILVHCSSASHREWAPLMARLRGGHSILAPDLAGYGRSARWPEGRPFDGSEDFEIVARLGSLAGEPVHLIGHSYGAAVALRAACELGSMVRSVVLVEPAAFQFLVRPGYEKERAAIWRLACKVRRHMAARRRRRAAAADMGFWIGRMRWLFTPKRIKRSVYETMDKVAAEFALLGANGALKDGVEFRAFHPPVRLIHGERTAAPAKAVVAVLENELPECDVRIVAGAGHMSPFTHADAVSTLITQHLAAH
jgi:pimeloyl-ACP methyl ester carboxylesterase